MKTMSEKPEQMPDNAADQSLMTFALFAYNQEKYIREAIMGAFSHCGKLAFRFAYARKQAL